MTSFLCRFVSRNVEMFPNDCIFSVDESNKTVETFHDYETFDNLIKPKFALPSTSTMACNIVKNTATYDIASF